jgi:hypothetical protein
MCGRGADAVEYTSLTQVLKPGESGNNLKIELMGTNTSVSVSGSNQLQEITAGGLKLDSQMSQLVQAMATYSASPCGFDRTSASMTAAPNDSAPQAAIAAAWHN